MAVSSRSWLSPPATVKILFEGLVLFDELTLEALAAAQEPRSPGAQTAECEAGAPSALINIYRKYAYNAENTRIKMRNLNLKRRICADPYHAT